MNWDQINWIIAGGSAGLGVVIGLLIASYWLDLGKTTLPALSSIVAIAVGGAVLGFFKFLSGPGTPAIELWGYGIGLFFGFCGLSAVEWCMRGYQPVRAGMVGDTPVARLEAAILALKDSIEKSK